MINLSWDGDSLISKFYGDIDHFSCAEIREVLDCEIQNRSPQSLILDLTHVDFMDSSGIGVIMGRYKKLKDRGGKMFFKGINPRIDRLVKLSGLLQIIKPIDSEKRGA